MSYSRFYKYGYRLTAVGGVDLIGTDTKHTNESLEEIRKIYNQMWADSTKDGIVPYISKIELISHRTKKVVAVAKAPMFEVVS